MHFLLMPQGSSGDVNPLLGIGRELARRGHEVTVATCGYFAETVQRAGLRFVEQGTKEQYLTMKPPASECCAAAPPILEFNEAGDLVGHWGGPGEGYEWPASNHGIDVDFKGNVWIGGNGRGQRPAALPADEMQVRYSKGRQ